MRRRDPASRYRETVRHEQRKLEEFAANEIEWAQDLLRWYKLKKLEMPDDEYRGAAFFINREYLRKPGSLTLLYYLNERCYRELPEPTRENAFDLLAYRFKLYAMTLTKGGY